MDEKDEFSFKKIFGVIPNSLYEKILAKNLFNNNWDAWLSKAVSKALEEEDNHE